MPILVAVSDVSVEDPEDVLAILKAYCLDRIANPLPYEDRPALVKHGVGILYEGKRYRENKTTRWTRQGSLGVFGRYLSPSHPSMFKVMVKFEYKPPGAMAIVEGTFVAYKSLASGATYPKASNVYPPRTADAYEKFQIRLIFAAVPAPAFNEYPVFQHPRLQISGLLNDGDTHEEGS